MTPEKRSTLPYHAPKTLEAVMTIVTEKEVTGFESLNLLSHGVKLFNRDRREVFSNTAARNLSPVQKDAVTMAIGESFSSEIRATRLDMVLLAGYSSSADVQTEDGKCLRIELHPDIAGENPNLAVMEIHDVTREKSEAANRKRDEARIEHDIKNDLTSIRGYAQLAERALQKNNPDIETALSHLEKIDQRVDKMDKSLISEMESIERGLKREIIPVQMLITQALAGQIAEIGLNSIQLKIQNTNAVVCVDPQKYACVFGNIIGNAIKYMKGPVKDLEITFNQKDGKISVGVSDTGIGIKPEDREKIFTPYFRAETNPAQKGAGMGLSIAKTMAQMHEGDVYLAFSEAGKGSTFIVEIPLCEPPV